MFTKAFSVLLPVAFGGVYFAGGFESPFSRDVARPQAEVMSALADLDIRKQPGAPGTDASLSGGVPSLFKLERGSNSMTWLVMSGDQVAMRMIASFEPINDGKGTRVVTSVGRGDAPDDIVSPAFRSEAVTLGLFSVAVDDELTRLTRKHAPSTVDCVRLYNTLIKSHAPASASSRPTELKQAVAGVAKTTLMLTAVDGELRRNGCDNHFNSGRSGLVEPDAATAEYLANPDGYRSSTQPEVSFEPGKPMIDLSKHSR